MKKDIFTLEKKMENIKCENYNTIVVLKVLSSMKTNAPNKIIFDLTINGRKWLQKKRPRRSPSTKDFQNKLERCL
jgi:hypothetical protein